MRTVYLRTLGASIACVVTVTLVACEREGVKEFSGTERSSGKPAVENVAVSLGPKNPALDLNAQAGNERSSSVHQNGDRSNRYKPLDQGYTPEIIQKWVVSDQSRRGSAAGNYRYSFIPPEMVHDANLVNFARIGLSKALNSVAPQARDIVHPEDVSDGYGLVYAFDISALWGNRSAEKWNFVARAVPKQVIEGNAPVLQLKPFNADQPVQADRLAYNLLHAGIYNYLHDVPLLRVGLLNRIGAGEPIERVGLQQPITFGPRFVQRRPLKSWEGSYWESFDDFLGRRIPMPWLNGSIPQVRPDGMISDFGPLVASEAWNHMPNGLIAYYIWGAGSQERTMAEKLFVVDPLNPQSKDVINGFCAFCHAGGVQSAKNDMYAALKAGRVNNAERVSAFWTADEQLVTRYTADREIFLRAMRKIVDGISGGSAEFNYRLANVVEPREPIYVLVQGIHGARAARSAGFR
jgi:hypothetical protein